MSASQEKQLSLIPGLVIVCGTAVGAGMFSMPIVSAGMWFYWALVAMLVCWFCMLNCSLLIAKISEAHPPGASFDSYVKASLGQGWNRFNSFLMVFVFYVLLYAYISGGTAIVKQSLQQLIGWQLPGFWAGLIFATLFSSFVFLSGLLTSRLISVLMLAMIGAFFISMSGLVVEVDIAKLSPDDSQAWVYLLPALPYFLTSFGFHAAVPSLVKLYRGQHQKVRMALYLGSGLIFVFYFIWLFAVYGNVERTGFSDFFEQGKNVDSLLSLIGESSSARLNQQVLGFFTNLALITSFLGVGLCLFDFFADRFKQGDDLAGRAKSAAITFVPPTIGALLLPHGFVYAIGYAGMAIALAAMCIPALMILKVSESGANKKMALFILFMGLALFFIELGNILTLLPVFGTH